MTSIRPGKQRKAMFNAPIHKKRRGIAAHMEENLLLKYDKRSLSVIKGDTVKVMRGSFKGHEDKVVRVNVKKSHIEIEGLTMSKADGNKIAKPIHPSNVMITKLNLTDKWRRKKLERGLADEVKKEIEKEAEEQIKEVEEEEKTRKLEEEAKATEEEIEETEKATEKSLKEEKEEKPKTEVKKKTPTKTKPKKQETKKPVKKTETKPKTEKKKTTPKKTTKKEEKNK
jgi:large subunit ribosomal protein L24